MPAVQCDVRLSVVTLSKITRLDWVRFDWIEITCVGDTERSFIQGYERTPAEANRAAQEWGPFAEVHGIA